MFHDVLAVRAAQNIRYCCYPLRCPTSPDYHSSECRLAVWYYYFAISVFSEYHHFYCAYYPFCDCREENSLSVIKIPDPTIRVIPIKVVPLGKKAQMTKSITAAKTR